jgi:hypothetical protein
MEEAQTIVSDILGPRSLSLYRRARSEEKKINFTEMLFKACLAAGTRGVTKSWDFRSESRAGLDSIYNAIYSAGKYLAPSNK